MNTFTVRCLGVRQDGRHIHVKFAQPGAGHFNLTFPETHQNEHDYTPGKDYQLSLSDILSMKKPEPQGESIDMSPVGLEDIPQGLEPDSDKVGGDNNPNPDEVEEKRQDLLDALENHEADLMEKEAKDVPDTNVGDITKAKKPAAKKKAAKTTNP